jgi:hypothetical protein
MMGSGSKHHEEVESIQCSLTSHGDTTIFSHVNMVVLGHLFHLFWRDTSETKHATFSNQGKSEIRKAPFFRGKEQERM